MLLFWAKIKVRSSRLQWEPAMIVIQGGHSSTLPLRNLNIHGEDFGW